MGFLSGITKTLFGGSEQSSQTPADQVWGPQVEYFRDLYSRASDLSQQPQNQQALSVYQGMAEGNPWLQSFRTPQISPEYQNYSRQLQQDFNTNILPAIQGQAAIAGGLGGSRQQIAEGMAADTAANMLSNFAAQTYGAQQDRSLQAAMGNLDSQFQGAQMLQQSPWFNLQQFKGILGNPLVIDQGATAGSSTSPGLLGGLGSFLGGIR